MHELLPKPEAGAIARFFLFETALPLIVVQSVLDCAFRLLLRSTSTAKGRGA